MLSANLTAAALAAAGPGADTEAYPVADPVAGLPAPEIPAVAPAETVIPEPAFGGEPVPSAPAAEDAAPPPAPAQSPVDAAVATDATAAANDDDFLAGEIVKPDDPFEPVNRLSFDLFWAIDRIAIRPAAMAYRAVVPKPLRDGARNALNNLGEPLVFANDILQLKPKRALKTLARFVINTAIGLGGLFDIAKREPFKIEYHYNSLGTTLGVWGIGPGPYLFLPIGAPIVGPTTLRDLADWPQGLLYPKKIDRRFDSDAFNYSTTVVGGLDERERNDAELQAMFSDAIDKYATFRANFLQNRAGEIAALKANEGEAPKASELDDPLTDPAGEAPPAGGG